MTIPPLLVPGDEVLVISPSSHPTTDRWIQGIEVLEAWGLKVRRGKHYLSAYEGFGGTDEERLEDLQVGPKHQGYFSDPRWIWREPIIGFIGFFGNEAVVQMDGWFFRYYRSFGPFGFTWNS